jgi:hypothetical protein
MAITLGMATMEDTIDGMIVPAGHMDGAENLWPGETRRQKNARCDVSHLAFLVRLALYLLAGLALA